MAVPGAEELYESAPCGLLVAASGGLLLRANATACGWLGFPVDELVGKLRLQDLLTAGGRIFFATHLQPLIRLQSSVSEVKLEMRRRDGKPVPVIVNIAERTVEGMLMWQVALFIAEDRHKYERELMAQRRRAEELHAQHMKDEQELSQARAQAEVRAQFAEQLVGVVSHDIRNPLSVIHMSAAMLQKGVSAEQQATVVARIERSVGRVQHLVSDLLDFTEARLGRGLRVQPRPVDLHHALAESVGELGIAFPDRTIVHQPLGPGECRADPDRIAQAVGNLVANALNHGAQDQPVTVRSQGGEGSFRITVHNHGPAIPAAQMPLLFEPMVRGADVLAQGVGLGLFIVREIAAAHGGSVRATSSPEDGTAFIIELPRE
ncbi:HAMP domain-containing histidine kinase [Ramlibacter sp. XY19]|uniref:PAS domain-containing sensor histidine kinase n=1 Tax=Ramlibacter paludis TaxID=2908000 RepID=UPI0023DB69D1|nr:HAMP domain-containing sensor histidine kinase [Ramlibacter paludis]MCG2595667.1 HAMP domain-containing histidine kinase [Ramlibacter paludis]